MKYFDEDGKEYDLPSESEIAELKAQAESGKSAIAIVQGIKTELQVGEDQDVLEVVKTTKESINPNWPNARRKIDKLTSFIKSSNQEATIDEEGNVITKKNMDPDQILKASEDRTRKILQQEKIDGRLSRYPAEKREVVKTYFDKLSAGIELNTDADIDKVYSEAEKLVFPQVQPGIPSFGGGEPNLEPKGSNFAETPAGQEAASRLFGDEAFPNQPKK